MSNPYIMLVTADEYAEITKFVQMGLDRETLARAIGEIVGVPGPELALPLHYRIDDRAPQLRFCEHIEPTPPPPPAAGPSDSPSPVDIDPIYPLIDSARKVYLIAEL